MLSVPMPFSPEYPHEEGGIILVFTGLFASNLLFPKKLLIIS